MHTNLSLHGTKNITARTTGTSGAPLQLRLEGSGDGYNTAEVCIYTDDPVLTDRLIQAINAVCEARRNELLLKSEAEIEAAVS